MESAGAVEPTADTDVRAQRAVGDPTPVPGAAGPASDLFSLGATQFAAGSSKACSPALLSVVSSATARFRAGARAMGR
jgi:hypothetical protein